LANNLHGLGTIKDDPMRENSRQGAKGAKVEMMAGEFSGEKSWLARRHYLQGFLALYRYELRVPRSEENRLDEFLSKNCRGS
jgi:hypothetical protein